MAITRQRPNAAIIAWRKRLDADLAAAQEAVTIVHFQMRNLQRQCQHPNEVVTSHMGEPCRHCYDCGNCP